MPEILFDGDIGWFDPGPTDLDDPQVTLFVHQFSPEVEARRLQGLQDAWDCPKRGAERREAASKRMRLAWAEKRVPQPFHTPERRARTSELMKEVWAKRKAERELIASRHSHKSQ